MLFRHASGQIKAIKWRMQGVTVKIFIASLMSRHNIRHHPKAQINYVGLGGG
jgi:hypothetical protein